MSGKGGSLGVDETTLRVAEPDAAENHGAVCAVLRWAKRTPGVTGDEIGTVCEQLGLNLLDAMAYGHRKARQR